MNDQHDLTPKDVEDDTPLMSEAMKADPDDVQMDVNVNLNEPVSEDDTPLMSEAIENSDSADIDVNVENLKESTSESVEGFSEVGEYMKTSDVQSYIQAEFERIYKSKSTQAQMEIDARRAIEDASREAFVGLMKDSPEPWVEMTSFRIDDNGQIRTEVDWNDAFIAELKRNKYEGITDEELVQKWLLIILAQTSEGIAEE